MGWVGMIGITFGSFLSGVFFPWHRAYGNVWNADIPPPSASSRFSHLASQKKTGKWQWGRFSAIATDGRYEKY